LYLFSAATPQKINTKKYFFGQILKCRAVKGLLMNQPVDEFLSKYPADVSELVLHARALILEAMPDAIEQLDPSANLIGYGTDRTYKGLICGIVIYRTYINLMFARGASLPDPDGLLHGTGKRARHIKIEKPADLEFPGVRAMLESALHVQ
jgi:hypothetical protein